MTQMASKAGIKKHGKVAIDALFQEFSQLHGMGVFERQDARKLINAQKRAALRAITTVADGRFQRKLSTKEQTTSPTVSTYPLMLSILIDALERRNVATADVTGAYPHAHMKDFTLSKWKESQWTYYVTHCPNTKSLYAMNMERRSCT